MPYNEEIGKIKFRHLSLPLKWAVVLAWISGTMFMLFYIIGVIEGLLFGGV